MRREDSLRQQGGKVASSSAAVAGRIAVRLRASGAQLLRSMPSSWAGNVRWFTLFALIIAGFALAFCGMLFFSQPSYAASGQVYSGTLQRCYKHPVTGVIEDAGGQKSYATGQGMVEGSLGATCMMEQTTDGKYYLTIRLSLIDYTSKRSFKVQRWGASGWSSTRYGVTKKGKNTDGTTYDYCIQVPAKNAIVRMTMYVKPMGRSVVCYFYAKNLKAGKPSGWNATIVTSKGAVKADTASNTATSTTGSTSNKTKSAAKAKRKAATSKSASTSTSSDADASTASDGTDSTSSGSSSTDLSGSGVNSAQGLDLSTQSSSSSDSDDSSDTGASGLSAGQLFATVFGAVLAGGIVLIAVAAGVIYYFRKHWAQWGSVDPDDYEQDYRDSVAAARGSQAGPSSAERAADSVVPVTAVNAASDDGTIVIPDEDLEVASDGDAANAASHANGVSATDATQVIPTGVSDAPQAPDASAVDATQAIGPQAGENASNDGKDA